MATSFDKITKLMLMEMQDNTISKMDTDIALDLISDLIITSATVDFSYCKKDLSEYTAYNDIVTNIDISEDKINLIIQRKDKSLNDVIVRVNDIEIEDYSCEFTDTEIIITYPFKKGDCVAIIEYFLGEFAEDLNSRERYIVALGANLHYIQQKILKEENIKVHFGDKDYKQTSSWNTLKTLLELKQMMDIKLKNYIDDYKYDVLTVEDLM